MGFIPKSKDYKDLLATAGISNADKPTDNPFDIYNQHHLKIDNEVADLNLDGYIDILDIIELVIGILNGNTVGIEFYLSDINGDDILNIQDLIALVNFILIG